MLASLLITSALAQDPTLPAEPAPAPPLTTAAMPARAPQDARQARGVKIAGQVITGVGLTFGGLGTGLGVWGAASMATCSFECMGPAILGASAALSSGVGVVLTSVGAPMWGVGAKNERHAVQLSVAPIVGPQGGGFALGGRF